MTSLGLFQISPPDNVIDGAQLAQDDSQPNSRIDLSEEEQYGGHGISEHVGQSEVYLKSRVRDEAARILDRGDDFRGLSVGSFTSLQSANRLVNSTVSQNQDRVDAVARGEQSTAFVRSRFGSPTGYEAYLPRANAEPYMRDTFGVGVVVLRDARATRGWRIQSAYPER